MGYEKMMEKMTFLMCGDDLCRISTSEEAGVRTIYIDLHGLSKKCAIRMIQNTIAMFRGDFRLELVHGYNHGTAIKEYIYKEMKNNRVINKQSPNYNPGITELMIAAA